MRKFHFLAFLILCLGAFPCSNLGSGKDLLEADPLLSPSDPIEENAEAWTPAALDAQRQVKGQAEKDGMQPANDVVASAPESIELAFLRSVVRNLPQVKETGLLDPEGNILIPAIFVEGQNAIARLLAAEEEKKALLERATKIHDENLRLHRELEEMRRLKERLRNQEITIAQCRQENAMLRAKIDELGAPLLQAEAARAEAGRLINESLRFVAQNNERLRDAWTELRKLNQSIKVPQE